MRNQQETALLEAFRLMDDDEREFFLETAQAHTDGRGKRRPALTLIRGGHITAPLDGSLCGNLG